MPLDPFLQQSQVAVKSALKAGQTMFGGRFALQRHLGQGGMGEVWLAQDTTLDQPRALKFVLPALLSDAQARKRLRHEARLGTELAHPRIVRVFDFVEETGASPLAAVVMEFVEGRTLSTLLAEKETGFFEAEEIGRWMQDIAEGLLYAHKERQRFHLDLKPANIIIETATGRAKLLDFGISRSAKDTITRLTGQVSSGTLPYMSPQQLDGGPPCAADDAYGLGATMYELLTGTPPFFRGKLDDQIRTKVPESIMDRRRQNVRDGLNPGIGANVSWQWDKHVSLMLSKDPGERRLRISDSGQMDNAPDQPIRPSLLRSNAWRFGLLIGVTILIGWYALSTAGRAAKASPDPSTTMAQKTSSAPQPRIAEPVSLPAPAPASPVKPSVSQAPSVQPTATAPPQATISHLVVTSTPAPSPEKSSLAAKTAPPITSSNQAAFAKAAAISYAGMAGRWKIVEKVPASSTETGYDIEWTYDAKVNGNTVVLVGKKTLVAGKPPTRGELQATSTLSMSFQDRFGQGLAEEVNFRGERLPGTLRATLSQDSLSIVATVTYQLPTIIQTVEMVGTKQ